MPTASGCWLRLLVGQVAATAAALKLHVKDRFTSQPQRTHTHTRAHSGTHRTPPAQSLRFIYDKDFGVIWVGENFVRLLAKMRRPEETESGEKLGAASEQTNEIMNNGLIKLHSTK